MFEPINILDKSYYLINSCLDLHNLLGENIDMKDPDIVISGFVEFMFKVPCLVSLNIDEKYKVIINSYSEKDIIEAINSLHGAHDQLI